MNELSNSFYDFLRDVIRASDWEIRRDCATLYFDNSFLKHEKILDILRNDTDWRVRREAVRAFVGRNVPIEWLEDAIDDDVPNVRAEAVEVMQEKYVPSYMIKVAINDESWVVREMAVYLCKRKHKLIPTEWIIQLQNDKDEYVRNVAREVLSTEEDACET